MFEKVSQLLKCHSNVVVVFFGGGGGGGHIHTLQKIIVKTTVLVHLNTLKMWFETTHYKAK